MRFLRFFWWPLLIFWVAQASSAAAQSSYIPPPAQLVVDENNVDPQSTALNYIEEDASAGTDTTEIKLARAIPTHRVNGRQQFGKWINNFTGYVYTRYDNSDDPSPSIKIGDTTVYAVIGSTSYSFTQEYMSPWEPNNPATSIVTTGTTPNLTVTVTSDDGTVYVFDTSNAPCQNQSDGYLNFCGNLARITKPNGETWEMDYEPWSQGQRLKRARSNMHYDVLFEYSVTATDQPSKSYLVSSANYHVAGLIACPTGNPATAYTPTSATKADGSKSIYAFTYGQPNDFFAMRGPSDTQFKFHYTKFFNGGAAYRRRSALNGTGGEVWSYQGVYVDSCRPDCIPKQTTRMDITDPQNNMVRFEWKDVINNGGHFIEPLPNQVTNALGQVQQIEYGLNGGFVQGTMTPKIVTQPETNRVTYTYDGRNNRLTQTENAKLGSSNGAISLSAAYPATCNNPKTCNKPMSFTDAKGAVTAFTYDSAHGGILTETRPAPTAGGVQFQKRYTYAQFYAWQKNASGNLVQAAKPIWLITATSECNSVSAPACVGTADETRITFAYGAAGSVNNLMIVSQTVTTGDNSLSATTSWTYDIWGNRLSEDGPLAGASDTTRWRYDVMRRVTGEIGPDPDGTGPLPHQAIRNSYDADGRLVKAEQGTVLSPSDADWTTFVPLQAVEFQYDILNRKMVERVRGSDNVIISVTQYSYDTVGRLQCMAVRMNPAVWTTLPASACTLQTAGVNGPDRITRNTYDATSQVTKVEKAVGTPLQQNYVQYSYTANGQIDTVTDANGNKAKMDYDGFDRLQRWRFPSKTATGTISTTDYEEYAYDANGNRTSLRKRDGSVITFSYDALDRVTRKTVPERLTGAQAIDATHTRDVFYGYDLRGLQLYARFDSGAATAEGLTTAYDGLGRTKYNDLRMNSVTRRLSYTWDADGSRTSVKHPDNQTFSYDFDKANRVTAIRFGTTQLAGFTYNARGLPATMTGGVTNTYAYDPVGRPSGLTLNASGTAQDTAWTYARNPAGQIKQQTRSNNAYGWTGSVNVNRAYAVNGLNQYTSAGPASFTYDANGNLTGDGTNVYKYDGENRLVYAKRGTDTAVSLRYDPLGRLYEVAQGTAITRFLYDGDELVAEYDGAGVMTKRYVHGAAVDDPILEYTGATVTTTTARRLRADVRGSVVLATDWSGVGQAINSYDEYGIPASTNTGRFQYTGQIWLPELGMYHYKARIYSPTLGRFLQTDPVGYDDQMNLYAYVGNDPVNNVDPDGLAIETVWDVANVAIGVASAGANIAAGNYGKAAVDVVGVVVDVVATAVPVVPGGAGTAIKVARGADNARDAARGSAGGERAGKSFTPRGKETIDSRNVASHGKPTCETCKRDVTPGQRSERGVRPPGNERQRDHIVPRSKGGDGTPSNGQVLCRDCNLKKRDRIAD